MMNRETRVENQPLNTKTRCMSFMGSLAKTQIKIGIHNIIMLIDAFAFRLYILLFSEVDSRCTVSAEPSLFPCGMTDVTFSLVPGSNDMRNLFDV